MQTLRIFISSPGDVAEERERARQVVQGLRRRYARHFELLPVLWEDMPLGLDASFQEGIDVLLSKDKGVDIAVFILWSRLGSPLGPLVRGENGQEYRSGTERELTLMLEARRQQGGKRPQILAYARQDEASFEEGLRGKTTAEKEELVRQKRLVEEFIREEFHDAETGTNVRAYHTFEKPQSFGERLRAHLQEILDGMCVDRPARPLWEIDAKGPPFRGLEPFRFEHRDIFFGREDEVTEARSRLLAATRSGTAFLLIGGASGTGKSSLMAAGLLPDIVGHETDNSIGRLLQAEFTPVALVGDPAVGMARILFKAVPSLEARGDRADFAAAMAKDPALAVNLVLVPAIKAEEKPGDSAVRLVLLVDQLEELFSDPRLGEKERDSFASILQTLATSGRVWVVATIRGDWYPRLLECPGLVSLKNAGAQLDLMPPRVDAVRRMIEAPASMSGLTYERTGQTTLADRILGEVAEQAELLPLLEDFLRELFERRQGNQLTVAAYEEIGGIEGSLAKRAEASLASLPVAVQLALPEVLRRLVATGNGPEKPAVRRRVPLEGFKPGSPTRALVERLVADRLATASSSEEGLAEVAIAHEAILRVWPRAAALIREDAEFLAVRDRLVTRMREGAPLTAADPLLPAARAILDSRRGSLDPELCRYVEREVASLDAERRRRDRLRNGVAAGLATLTIAATAAAGIAWRQSGVADTAKRRAEESEQRALDSAKTAGQYAKSEAAQRLATEKQLEISDRLAYAGGIVQAARFATPAYDANAEDAAGAIRILESARPDLRGWEHDRLWSGLHAGHRTLRGHVGQVWGVGVSDDGRVLASCGEDGHVVVWDGESGAERWRVVAHEGQATGLAMSPDGQAIATGGADGTVKAWRVGVTEPAWAREGHAGSRVMAVALSANGARLASAGEDGTGALWDAKTGELLHVFRGHTAPVTSVALSADGRVLATGSMDQTVRVWHGETFAEEHVLRGHVRGVTAVALSADGRLLISGAQDFIAIAWDASAGTRVAELVDHTLPITAVALASDGGQVFTSSGDYSFKGWRIQIPLGNKSSERSTAFGGGGGRPQRPQFTYRGHTDWLTSIAATGDGLRIVTGGEDGTVKVWGAEFPSAGAPMVIDLPFVTAAVSADGQWVVIGQIPVEGRGNLPDDPNLALAIGGDEGPARVRVLLEGHEGRVVATAISDDGDAIVTGSADGTAIVWSWEGTLTPADDPKPGVFAPPAPPQRARLRHRLRGHEGAVSAVAIDGNGKRLATGGVDRTVRLWDTSEGNELRVFPACPAAVWSVCLSRDGHRILAGCEDGTAVLFDADTGAELVRLRDDKSARQVTSVALSADGGLAAIGTGDNAAVVWDTRSAAIVSRLSGYSGWGTPLVFSPDGRRIFCGGKNPYICDAFTGTALLPLDTNHIPSAMAAVSLSTDANTVFLADTHGFVVKDAAGVGQSLIPLGGHESPVVAVGFEEGDTRIVSRSADATITRDAATLRVVSRSEGSDSPGTAMAEAADGGRKVAVVGGRGYLVNAAHVDGESGLWKSQWEKLLGQRDWLRRAKESDSHRKPAPRGE